jgi:hypothetical protein
MSTPGFFLATSQFATMIAVIVPCDHPFGWEPRSIHLGRGFSYSAALLQSRSPGVRPGLRNRSLLLSLIDHVQGDTGGGLSALLTQLRSVSSKQEAQPTGKQLGFSQLGPQQPVKPEKPAGRQP